MPSIADSLTPQVITEIFKQVQDHYYGPSEPFHDRSAYIRFFNAPSMMYDNKNERRDFRHFPSRSWKAVSDTYVFRDLRITIGYPLFDKRRAVAGYHSAGHRFLEEMFRAGYAPLIRNVHLELLFNDHALQLPAPDLVEQVRSQIFAFTDSVCKLLLEQSCRTLALYCQSIPAADTPHPLADAVASKIMDALGKLPKTCEVELSTKFIRRVPSTLSYDKWLTNTAPQLL